MKKQRIGLHVSAAGGVVNAPERAKDIGAECFQFFSRSPRGGIAPQISETDAKLFQQRCAQYGMESYIHTPYYINFAAPKKELAESSVRVVRDEMERASMLGVKYVITHLGSARDWPGAEKGKTPGGALKRTIKGLRAVLHGNPKFTARLLLEISAGTGSVIGNSFEELAYIIKGLGKKNMQVCLDTCHMFSAGYDLRTKEAIDETMKQFREQLGLERLKLVHVNDSKTGLGELKDRHEHIGAGKIGEEGFKALLAHPDFQQVNFVLETKHDDLITQDLEKLKEWRKQA
jgi:deoxyribonuclease-4